MNFLGKSSQKSRVISFLILLFENIQVSNNRGLRGGLRPLV